MHHPSQRSRLALSCQALPGTVFDLKLCVTPGVAQGCMRLVFINKSALGYRVVREFNKRTYRYMRRVSAYLRVLAIFFPISRSHNSNMTQGQTSLANANAHPTICLHKTGPPFYKPDSEYGVACGIDFRDVACVLDIDPPTFCAHIYASHGPRCASCAGRGGTTLTFVLPLPEFGKPR